MSIVHFTVTNGPEDPDEPGWRLEGFLEGPVTFTPNIPTTDAGSVDV